jgi:hypothetical protein
MVRMAHPTDIAIHECPDFTNQLIRASLKTQPAVCAQPHTLPLSHGVNWRQINTLIFLHLAIALVFMTLFGDETGNRIQHQTG